MATEYNLGRVIGQGMPVGGAEGETLIKNSGQNFDARWGQLPESDPTVPAWAKQPEKPAYTAAEVGAGVPAKQISKTLSTSWAGGTQALEDASILSAATIGAVYIAQSATVAQYEAFQNARLQATAQEPGSVTVTARGTVPAVNIPVILEIRG